MIIEEIMQTNIVTLTADQTIEEAMILIKKKGIRHIPIVNNQNELIGLVSDRDIRDASPSIFHSEEHLEDLQKPISTIMVKDVITGSSLDFVEEVSAIFYEHRIGCLPIIRDKKLAGIVTETDMLYTLVQLTGADQPSTRIEVMVDNRAGMLSEVCTSIKKYKVNIISVLVYPYKNDLSKKVLVFRVQTMNPLNIIKELTNKGYVVSWPTIPGETL